MFESPDTLRKYALAVSAQMRSEGLAEQSKILEHRANLPCTSGWEWLGELGLGVEKIISSGSLSKNVEEKLNRILITAKSSTPYR